jgi:hypothetical protein
MFVESDLKSSTTVDIQVVKPKVLVIIEFKSIECEGSVDF